jgi:hypothetical protein
MSFKKNMLLTLNNGIQGRSPSKPEKFLNFVFEYFNNKRTITVSSLSVPIQKLLIYYYTGSQKYYYSSLLVHLFL